MTDINIIIDERIKAHVLKIEQVKQFVRTQVPKEIINGMSKEEIADNVLKMQEMVYICEHRISELEWVKKAFAESEQEEGE